jgi:hypothetical protein
MDRAIIANGIEGFGCKTGVARWALGRGLHKVLEDTAFANYSQNETHRGNTGRVRLGGGVWHGHTSVEAFLDGVWFTKVAIAQSTHKKLVQDACLKRNLSAQSDSIS